MDKPPSPDHQPAIPAGATTPRQRRIAIAALLIGALSAGIGQTIVFSILPPLARDLGLSEMQVGSIFMIAAIGWVLASPHWGRASDQFGRKPFILVGICGFAISAAIFGSVLHFGLTGAIAGMTLYVLLILGRSINGVAGSAGPAAAQAYIADRTTKSDRAAGMAGFGAAFGLGAMLGPGLGAAISVIDPAAPFFFLAAFNFLLAIAIWFLMPERNAPRKREAPAKLKFTDPRFSPFIAFGFCYSMLAAIPLQTIGFFFIDRLGFSTELAPQLIGAALMGSAMASLFSQLVVVQRFRLPPSLLMRIAPFLTIAGHLLIFFSADVGPVIFGMTVAGFGTGLAMPGLNAGASLAVEKHEQGAAIGLVNAGSTLGFVAAPPIAFTLYDLAPNTPFAFTTALAGAAAIFAFTNQVIRNATPPAEVEIDEAATENPASSPYQ